MKVVDQLRRVFQDFSGFSGELMVANPTHKIFQRFGNRVRVKYYLNHKFNVVVNNNWGGAGCFCPARGLVAAGSRRDMWKTG